MNVFISYQFTRISTASRILILDDLNLSHFVKVPPKSTGGPALMAERSNSLPLTTPCLSPPSLKAGRGM